MSLVTLTAGTKIVGLSENGPIPDPSDWSAKRLVGCFFHDLGRQNTYPEQFKRADPCAYTNAYVMNLGDLPKLRIYLQSAAKRQLAFVAAVPAMAVGSPARRAVIVGWRMPRDASYAKEATALPSPWRATRPRRIYVALQTSECPMVGWFFADLCLDRQRNCVLIASAQGLREAKILSFRGWAGAGNSEGRWNNAGK